jgi:hypothetical protein
VTPGHLLLACHGCDATTRDDLVMRRLLKLEHSQNEYDWLGPGSYFFESDPQRAMSFARASAGHPERLYTKRPIATPAVVGAVICVTSCLDMATQVGLDEFADVLEHLRQTNTPIAQNDTVNPLLRRLNNQVFTSLHALRHDLEYERYQMVRGAFVQGAALGDANSGFNRDNHIQLAVRDPDAVVSWFVPKPDRLMTADEYKHASTRLSSIADGHARKPRVRASWCSKGQVCRFSRFQQQVIHCFGA